MEDCKQILFDTFTRYANQPALLSADTTLNWGQLHGRITDAMRRLEQTDICENARVAILGANQVELVILCFALWYKGCVVVPVSTRWPHHLVRESLNSISCKRIITGTDSDLGDVDIKSVELTRIVTETPLSQVPIEIKEFNVNSEGACTIIYTSGSSGKPKATLHSWANHYYNALGSNSNIAFEHGDRWLLSLPLYHVGGMAILFRALVSGGCIAIPDSDLSLPDNIEKLQVTHVSMVATQLYRILQNEQTSRLASLKAILLGGSAIPKILVRKAVDYKLPVYTSYGSTEMASQVTTTRPGDSIEFLLSSGALLPYRELKIAATGEIMVKGRTLFQGYVKEKPVPGTDAEGWFASGDLGFIDDQGYLHVTGRKDNMFISGGENIYPEEIEAALLLQDEIIQAIVVPVENLEFGYRPAAFVQCRSAKPDFDRIKKDLAGQLPQFKIPQYFFAWPDNISQTSLKTERVYFVKAAARLLGILPPEEQETH